MQTIFRYMHQICTNMPLHRLHCHFNIAHKQIICIKYASNMLNMQQKYAKNMQKICRICITSSISLCIICTPHFADGAALRRGPAGGGWWHWHWHTMYIWWAFLKPRVAISRLQVLSLRKSSLTPGHCTKWNAEIQVFSSVPCTSDVGRYIYHSLSFDP